MDLRNLRRTARLAVVLGLAAIACVKAKAPTDTSYPGYWPGAPSSPLPSSAMPGPIAYTDLTTAFFDDCLRCHNDSSAAGNYSMSNYAAVMRDVRPGDASSRLVVDTQPGGNMYQYWSGDANAKAAAVFYWVVVYNAAQSR
jgi:hypothetical protein